MWGEEGGWRWNRIWGDNSDGKNEMKKNKERMKDVKNKKRNANFSDLVLFSILVLHLIYCKV